MEYYHLNGKKVLSFNFYLYNIIVLIVSLFKNNPIRFFSNLLQRTIER